VLANINQSGTSVDIDTPFNTGGEYRAEIGYTEYRIRVNVTNLNGWISAGIRGYSFTASTNTPDLSFGVTANEYITFLPRLDENNGLGGVSLAIKQQPTCLNIDGGAFDSYDYDNVNGNDAQMFGGGAFGPNPPGTYSPLNVSFGTWGAAPFQDAAVGGFDPNVFAPTAPPNWQSLGNGQYQPNQTASGQFNRISYSTVPHDPGYYYYLHGVGRNYIGLKLPFPGAPACKLPTFTVTAGGGGRIQSGNTAPFRAKIDVADAAFGAGKNFVWNVTGYSAVGNTTTPINGANPRANGDLDAVINAPGTYCRTITLVSYEVGRLSGPGSAGECFDVWSPPTYKISTTRLRDYEKGGDPPIVRYELWGTPPCGPGTVADNVTWGGTGIANRLAVNAADTTGLNCAERLIDFYDYTINDAVSIAAFNAAIPGPYGSYTAVVVSAGGTVTDLTGPISITVFEIPYVHFDGGDVKICGDGADNRFVFDDRAPALRGHGSYTQFMSLYRGANNPSGSFSGLNSSAINAGFWGRLLSSWGGLPNCTTGPSSTAGAVNWTNSPNPAIGAGDRTTYVSNGDIYITNSIYLDINRTPFNKNTHPVVVIYSLSGNIRIAPSVTNIDAILLAPNGNIYTCDNGTGFPARSDWEQFPNVGCRSPLVVNGALIANEVRFQRAIGSRYLNNTPSEVVNYPWYMPYINLSLPNKGAVKFDAYRSLPPRL